MLLKLFDNVYFCLSVKWVNVKLNRSLLKRENLVEFILLVLKNADLQILARYDFTNDKMFIAHVL